MIDAVGARHLREHVFELIWNAERDEILEGGIDRSRMVPCHPGTNWESPGDPFATTKVILRFTGDVRASRPMAAMQIRPCWGPDDSMSNWRSAVIAPQSPLRRRLVYAVGHRIP